MSPLPSVSWLFSVQPESETTGSVPRLLLSQWENPSDILSVLLILGPEIVQRAVAQLAGRGVTPVAFSFGWVAYATRALLNTFGDGRLMPEADMANTCVIGAASGHSRSTTAWVLGRLLRDEDDRVDDEMRLERAHVAPGATGHVPQLQPDEASRPAWEALRATVYSVDENPPLPHGVPVLDRVWYCGIVVIIIQVAIAIVPWAAEGDWSPFLITATGNILALTGASLPQWSQEKWACPKPPKGGSTVAITQGNGSRHAVIILGSKGVGLDLEILALGTRTARPSTFTRLASSILALLWIMLLISASGLNGGNSWYILGIGLLGSIQNMHAAGASRRPSALGIHLIHRETIRAKRVALVLKEVEEKYPTVGTSLLPVFFPGSLRVKGDDLVFWRKAIAAKAAPNKFGSRVGDFPTDAEKEEVETDETKAEKEAVKTDGAEKGVEMDEAEKEEVKTDGAEKGVETDEAEKEEVKTNGAEKGVETDEAEKEEVETDETKAEKKEAKIDKADEVETDEAEKGVETDEAKAEKKEATTDEAEKEVETDETKQRRRRLRRIKQRRLNRTKQRRLRQMKLERGCRGRTGNLLPRLLSSDAMYPA